MVLAKLSIFLLHRSAENPSASGFLYRNRECRPRSADYGQPGSYQLVPRISNVKRASRERWIAGEKPTSQD